MKDIKEYERLYGVTRGGDVFSYKRKKFLKARKNTRGYLYVGLYKDGKRKNYLIHRLVAEAYIENPDNKEQVNHKDGNKENNNVNNLEWCTNSENIKHAYDNGLCEKTREVVSKNAKQNNIKYKSKPVEVIFPDGNIETYRSAIEADRQLHLPLYTVSRYIKYNNGYYKKQNLKFRYKK